MLQLPEKVKILEKEGNRAKLEISPLMPGYGATIGNPLRRILFSSLEGAAVTSIKIKGIDHEFSPLPGVLEDAIEVILNVKKLRFKLHNEGPVRLTFDVTGVKEITGNDFELPSEIELINPDQHIATLTDKKSSLNMEIEVEKGIGYSSVEQRKKDKLAIGVLSIDAAFSPVRSVNFTVENIRVGQRIDFNKIVLDIETDGSIEPEVALKKASEILIDHMKIVSEVEIPEPKEKPAKTKKETKKKKDK